MFGKAYNVDKREFTKARLRDIQHAYKRFPPCSMILASPLYEITVRT